MVSRAGAGRLARHVDAIEGGEFADREHGIGGDGEDGRVPDAGDGRGRINLLPSNASDLSAPARPTLAPEPGKARAPNPESCARGRLSMRRSRAAGSVSVC